LPSGEQQGSLDTNAALETISCGYVGCDYWLWDAVYTACMGNPQ